jgi:hypothetical protein
MDERLADARLDCLAPHLVRDCKSAAVAVEFDANTSARQEVDPKKQRRRMQLKDCVQRRLKS